MYVNVCNLFCTMTSAWGGLVAGNNEGYRAARCQANLTPVAPLLSLIRRKLEWDGCSCAENWINGVILEFRCVSGMCGVYFVPQLSHRGGVLIMNDSVASCLFHLSVIPNPLAAFWDESRSRWTNGCTHWRSSFVCSIHKGRKDGRCLTTQN